MTKVEVLVETERVAVALSTKVSLNEQLRRLCEQHGDTRVLVNGVNVAERRRLDAGTAAQQCGTLGGSTRHDPEIRIQESWVPLPEVLKEAFARSGKSVEQWNALPEGERELWVDRAIATWKVR